MRWLRAHRHSYRSHAHCGTQVPRLPDTQTMARLSGNQSTRRGTRRPVVTPRARVWQTNSRRQLQGHTQPMRTHTEPGNYDDLTPSATGKNPKIPNSRPGFTTHEILKIWKNASFLSGARVCCDGVLAEAAQVYGSMLLAFNLSSLHLESQSIRPGLWPPISKSG